MSAPVRIRASSWSDLFDCAMRWKAKNLDGIYSPSTPAAHIGTSIHTSTAIFDQASLSGSPISVNDAADVLMDAFRNPEEEVYWTDKDPSPKEAELIALRLHVRYCNEIAPTQKYVAIEAKCESMDIDVGNGVIIQLTGTTDRVRITPDNKYGISDIKSGLRRVSKGGAVDTKSDGAQLGVYEILAENALGITIDGEAEIIGLQTTKTGEIGIGAVPNSRDVLVGTEGEPGLLEFAGMYLKSGLFPPNPRSMLCTTRYCPIFDKCKHHN